jgi:peptidoglycan/LPS O-acetylase OafA/YrhL
MLQQKSSERRVSDAAPECAASEPNHNQHELSVKRRVESAARTADVMIARIWALDFIKGALVLIMVLYHWLNYFIGPEGSYYRYLTFLPPSFICITGFLISRVYLSKYRITDPRLPRRLAIRSLKLFAIFIVLNLAVEMIAPKVYTGKRSFAVISPTALWSVYVSGNMKSGRLVAFDVLVPICYLLFFSACLLVVCRYFKPAFHAATIVALLGVLALRLSGQLSENFELFSIGLLGISIGYIPIEKVNSVSQRRHAVVLLYLLYVAAITVWNAPFPLQVLGVLLTLMLLYMVGTAVRENGRAPRVLALLGRYSLFGYIAQIAILQIMRRAWHAELTAWSLMSSFLIAMSLTILSVEAVDRARSKLPMADRIYGAVFS